LGRRYRQGRSRDHLSGAGKAVLTWNSAGTTIAGSAFSNGNSAEAKTMKPGLKMRCLGIVFVSGTLAVSASLPARAVETDMNNVTAMASADQNAKGPACGEDVWSNSATAQAEHSAEATAHKTLHDPNNQLGTTLSGRTRGPGNCVVTAQAATIDGEAIE
jgi:hypothetical protein